jgi:hypothetical protein
MNTQPQDHSAEDRELAESIIQSWLSSRESDPLTESIQLITTARRAEREELERLKGVLMVQNDKVCIHHNDAERVKIFTGCPICKLANATVALELCEGALRQSIRRDGHDFGCTYDDNIFSNPDGDYCNCRKTNSKALAAIKEVKGQMEMKVEGRGDLKSEI